jgi:peptidyl-prolyl cis-trans isomerase B (cyclophilin B)
MNNENNEPLVATIKTTMGNISIELFFDQAPRTVSNFYNLAKKNFYNDLIFHRVDSSFVIQTGCPKGTGFGGPGYKFRDEFNHALRHERPGVVSMANGGPNTNGSQWFITLKACPHLDDRHSIFGEVIQGYDNVMRISDCQVDDNYKPIHPIKIKEISFNRKFKPINIGKVSLFSKIFK